jgi:hypothetical protein
VLQQPSPQTTLGDVLLGALGVAGTLLLLALALGALLSLLLVRWNRRHPPEADHLPSVSPFASRALPPSSPTR